MPTQIASDNFARASLGSNWTTVTGSGSTFGIVASTAVSLVALTGRSLMYWSGAGIFTPSQYSEMTLYSKGNVTTLNLLGPAVLISSSALTAYFAWMYSGSLYITKIVAGVTANLVNTTYSPNVNDILELSVTVGATSAALTASVNGVSKLTYTDSSSPILTGTPGIMGYDYTNLQTQWEYTPWSAGDSGSSTAGPTFMPYGFGF